ncbi:MULTISPECIES: HEPN domain-containing protein [unclassified Sphingomonas]|uniref:HEPN domain-containing protein n=1 Tax=unclassified Sphingomonas TaxID=196159 RepID=UPI00215107C0|nr:MULTISPECIES: HEPN domain-containing protein [unclassified Sphingomonas]MCR5871096.1 HEPN domain-containing protein [Sphingomonas sp. J344]UUY00587.1 HEPN domain-containing protein [Sphingomonas sp. J315]
MRSETDHLPERQQRELERVRAILLEEFDRAIGSATAAHKRNGKVLKIILFGSYAREDWVDEPDNGYQSDFDLLIVVSHADLTDIADYWYVAEDRIARDSSIARPVNIIVHALDEVNRSLSRGEYFWIDIARDGIALYELPGHSLAMPKPLTAADAHRMASEYCERWHESADEFLKLARYAQQEGLANKAAFLLHQATEHYYICFLLVQTLYFPRSHNIKFLRSLAEDKDPRLVDAWPRATKADRARFERLKRAYVEARYSASYAITREDLDALARSVGKLSNLVGALCTERLAALSAAEAG